MQRLWFVKEEKKKAQYLKQKKKIKKEKNWNKPLNNIHLTLSSRIKCILEQWPLDTGHYCDWPVWLWGQYQTPEFNHRHQPVCVLLMIPLSFHGCITPGNPTLHWKHANRAHLARFMNHSGVTRYSYDAWTMEETGGPRSLSDKPRI